MTALSEKTASSPPVPKREKQRQETRQRVYQAALVAFRRDGVHAARIDDIARAAGVSHGTFYFHFPTKDEVLREHLAISKQAVADAIVALPEGEQLPRLLEVVCEAIASRWQSDPQLFVDVGVVGLRQATEALPESPSDPLRTTLGSRFEAAAARGALTGSLPPALLADVFLVNVFAGALAWCATPTLPLVDVLKQVCHLFLHGANTGPSTS
jgi:AcrR family transcriptional regulator